jgi:Flp pilus assembly protein CpaB
MKPARIFVLVIALVAGVAAAILASTSKPVTVVVQQPPPPVPSDGVLAAANELFRGDVLTEANMRWDEWPAEKIPEGVIRKRFARRDSGAEGREAQGRSRRARTLAPGAHRFGPSFWLHRL